MNKQKIVLKFISHNDIHNLSCDGCVFNGKKNRCLFPEALTDKYPECKCGIWKIVED